MSAAAGSTGRFACAAASLARAEPLAGTATHVRTWLLLEHSGPWGARPLLDARLPEGLGPQLQARAAELRAKILLVRRARAARDPAELTVFAAWSDPVRPRLERGTVTDLRAVLDLDLAALARGGSSGLEPVDPATSPVFAVCTNGRHDACCAEFGRPAALRLDATHPEQAWEVSHVGGDRFAGNMVVLPHGLYYGRITADSAPRIAERHLAGELSLDELRGRASYPNAVQAAEIALLRELGLTGIDALRLTGRTVDGQVTLARFAAGTQEYDVRVRTATDRRAATRLTCKAVIDNPIPSYDVVTIEPVAP